MKFNSELMLVNEQAIDTKEIKDIIISYSSDSIHLYKNNSDELMLREYMNYMPEKDEIARIMIRDNSLIIESGERDKKLFMLGSYKRRIEVYVPLNYENNFEVNVSSGSIKSEEAYKFSNFKASGSSGSIKLKDIYADNINISVNSGSVNLENAEASNLRIKSSSGSIKVLKATGDSTFSSSSGSITVYNMEGKIDARASSGSIRVNISELNHDISASTSSGSVNISIPESSSFEFNAETSSGSIKTYFDSKLSYGRGRKEASAKIGDNPDVKIDLSASSGRVKLNVL